MVPPTLVRRSPGAAKRTTTNAQYVAHRCCDVKERAGQASLRNAQVAAASEAAAGKAATAAASEVVAGKSATAAAPPVKVPAPSAPAAIQQKEPLPAVPRAAADFNFNRFFSNS